MCPLVNTSTKGNSRHAPGERLVGEVLPQRVQPHHLVGEAVEPRHLLGEEGRIAGVEAVRAEDDDGAPGEAAVPVAVEKALRASPMRVPPSQSTTSDVARSSASSGLEARRPRDTRQARAEAERLPATVGTQRCMREDEQRARVLAHRAGDVEDEDEPAGSEPALAPCEAGRVTARPERPAHRPAQVELPCLGGATAARPPRRGGEPEPRHQPGELSQLLGRAGGEALVSEELEAAGAGGPVVRALVGRPRRALSSASASTGAGRGCGFGCGACPSAPPKNERNTRS